MKLPIEQILYTSPPRFKWHQTIDGQEIEHNGLLPSNMEDAVLRLISRCNVLERENAELRGKLQQQSELLKHKTQKAR